MKGEDRAPPGIIPHSFTPATYGKQRGLWPLPASSAMDLRSVARSGAATLVKLACAAQAMSQTWSCWFIKLWWGVRFLCLKLPLKTNLFLSIV